VITIQTSILSDNGGKVQAKGHDRTKTIPLARTQSDDRNHGKAAGFIVNALTNDEQRAKLLHPSGRQRVVVTRPEPGIWNWYIDV
jgi:hypothetical protein